MEGRFYILKDGEFYDNGPFDTEEEAIAEGRSMWPGEFFCVGKSGKYVPWTRDYVEELTELEACDVNDECGPDASDDWPPRLEAHSEEYKAANRQIAEIMAKLCGECSVFPISESREIEMEG